MHFTTAYGFVALSSRADGDEVVGQDGPVDDDGPLWVVRDLEDMAAEAEVVVVDVL